MAKKTFSRSELKSVQAGVDKVSTALEKPTGEAINELAPPVQPQELTQQGGGVPTPEPTAPIIEPTQPTAPAATSENVANAEVPVEPKSKPTPKAKKKAQPEPEADEKTKPVSLYLPLSVYKRLLAMKTDTDESLKALGLRAIEEMLKRNGY